jgi:hypothetical protein
VTEPSTVALLVADVAFFAVVRRERVRFAAAGSASAGGGESAGPAAAVGSGDPDASGPVVSAALGETAADGVLAAETPGCGGPAGRLADRRRVRRTGAACSPEDAVSGVLGDSMVVGLVALDPVVSSPDMHTPRCPRAQRAARRRVGR